MVTELLMVNAVKLWHHAKAKSPIVVTDSGMLRVPVQFIPYNAKLPIVVKLLPRDREELKP